MEILQYIKEQVHYIPQTVIVAILFIMSYIFISDNKGQIKARIRKLLKKRWIIAFLCYSAFLFTITIIARYVSEPIFSGIGKFGMFQNGKADKDVIFNITLFIPYTFCYIKAFTPQNIIRSSFLLSLSSTIFIEVFQFVFWVGHFTIADIIHNIVGGMIGCGIWYSCNMIRKTKNIRR